MSDIIDTVFHEVTNKTAEIIDKKIESELSTKALFSIPDFYNHFKLNISLVEMMEREKDLFRDNVAIDSVYGSFPGAIWNSGRNILGGATYDNIVSTLAPFAGSGISVRYTFTNNNITGRHLLDYYCNTILEISENLGHNGVTVNQEILANHIKNSYPNLYIVWSTTKGIKTIEAVDELSKDTLTVLDYSMNNTDIIPRLTHPENIEVLVCEACIPHCDKRQEHYKSIGEHQMLIPNEGFRCPHGCERYTYYDTVVKRPHYISPDDVFDKYIPAGINKFKISGRNDSPINVIENYARYFAKAEHVDNVRNKLLINHFSGN